MLYYKVKADADNKKRLDGSIYIANELYTPKEIEKLKLNKAFLQPVEVSKNRVYFFFGARFAN